MPTTNGNRKILDLKRWEYCTPPPVTPTSQHLIISAKHVRQNQVYISGITTANAYSPQEDGWVALPNPSLPNFTIGCCGAAGSFSTGSTAGAASLTATGGTTSTIVTNQTLARDLRGYSVHILAGPNAGVTLEILSNSIGANATITVATQASAFSASTVYRLMTPNFFAFGGGTLVSGCFKRYDFATNTWVTLANTGLPASFGTDAKLVSTPSWLDTGYKAFATGTATAGAASTITNTAKAWTTNQWTNAQIRITAGTGAGQIRTVASNTGTVITTSAAWTTQPDATSQYSIEGNDDFLYLMGNNAVAMYRYSISGNTWTTLAPGVARAGAPGQGMGGSWVHSVSATDWTSENAIQNGRYLYSFRGAAGTQLDRYDIALNTWSALTYAPATETFGSGTRYAYCKDAIYITKEMTGRCFRLDVATSSMEGWGALLFPQSGSGQLETMFDATYRDGATEIDYIYLVPNGVQATFRQMVI